MNIEDAGRKLDELTRRHMAEHAVADYWTAFEQVRDNPAHAVLVADYAALPNASAQKPTHQRAGEELDRQAQQLMAATGDGDYAACFAAVCKRPANAGLVRFYTRGN